MRQGTLSEAGFEKYQKKTRKEKFLEEMERIVPWGKLVEVIEPYYPKPEGAGRRPIGLERMLRIHFVQHWFNLSDPGVEEALYDSRALRRFVGIDLGREPAPDETTVCKFRHLLEEQGLGKKVFEQVNEYLKEHGMAVNRGTIVDATIIHAPSSAKNRRKERDPEMHQTRKGNQWYFGMKAHIGVDSRSKLIHSVEATAANVHDSRVLEKLLHGKERRVWGIRRIRVRRRQWPRQPRRHGTGLTRRGIAIGSSPNGSAPATATSPGFEPRWNTSSVF